MAERYSTIIVMCTINLAEWSLEGASWPIPEEGVRLGRIRWASDIVTDEYGPSRRSRASSGPDTNILGSVE